MAELPVTLRDVARRSGVHPATASRALNPATRMLVSEETAGRVLSAAAALGYRPNAVARSLRTRRSHHHRRAHPRPDQPAVPADRPRPGGRLAADGRRADRQHRLRRRPRADGVELMRARHVDGFVLATATLHNRVLAAAAQVSLLVVLVNRCPTSSASFGVGRQRARDPAGGRPPPGRAWAPPDRLRGLPAGHLHRPGPAARLPGRPSRPPGCPRNRR